MEEVLARSSLARSAMGTGTRSLVPAYDPYRTGTPMRDSVYGMAYDSVAMTSWTPKKLPERNYFVTGQRAWPIIHQAPTADKVQYLLSAKDLNHNVFLRHGSRVGLADKRSTYAASYTWKDPQSLSRPPSAILERMYDELMAPVTQKSLNPFFAPFPSDLARTAEEHGRRSQAALNQHRLRTKTSAKLVPRVPNGSLDSRPTTVDVPSAEGETAYTKSGPVFLKDADGGRKVLQLRYPGDAETAAAREAMEAERKSKRPLPGTYSMGVQVGGGYRPRTAEDFSMRSISSLDGTNLLQATRKPAPDYLRKPEHPRRTASRQTPVRPYNPSDLGPPPDGYVLVSDDYEQLPEFMRTSKERALLAMSSRPATAGASGC